MQHLPGDALQPNWGLKSVLLGLTLTEEQHQFIVLCVIQTFAIILYWTQEWEKCDNDSAAIKPHASVCVCIIEYFALEKNPENAQILRHHEAKKDERDESLH